MSRPVVYEHFMSRPVVYEQNLAFSLLCLYFVYTLFVSAQS
jgi:hypothetical protein